MRIKSRVMAAGLAGCLVAAFGSCSAAAKVFEFTLQGWLPAGSMLAGTAIASDTSFETRARFDTSSPNLVAGNPFAGFVAYTPTSLTLSSGGKQYAVQSYNMTTHLGFSLAVFDGTTPFGPPGHYAAGLIQDPVADGAGIVGDWLTAMPPFAAAKLVPTTFSAGNFFGVGFGSGICLANCRMPDEVDAVTPIPLMQNGHAVQLVLPSIDLTYSGFEAPGPSTDRQWSATLTAVPEPAMWMMMLSGFTMTGGFARRYGRQLSGTGSNSIGPRTTA